MHRYRGQRDLVIGSPVANRTRGELENLIGSFINTLAQPVDATSSSIHTAIHRSHLAIAFASLRLHIEQLAQLARLALARH